MFSGTLSLEPVFFHLLNFPYCVRRLFVAITFIGNFVHRRKPRGERLGNDERGTRKEMVVMILIMMIELR